VDRHADQAFLVGIDVGAHLISWTCVHQAAFKDDTDLTAATANLLRLMATEKGGHTRGLLEDRIQAILRSTTISAP
jgi:hypothetical protein